MAADLNLRNLDPKFIAKLKSDAALAGKTLREWCIGLLGGTDVDDRRDHGDVEAGDNRGRRVEGSAVPIVRKTKKPAKRLHPVQPVRDELAEQRGSEQEPTSKPCAIPGHTVFKQGSGFYCLQCGK